MDRLLNHKTTALGVLSIFLLLFFTQALPEILKVLKETKTENAYSGTMEYKIDELNTNIKYIDKCMDGISNNMLNSITIQKDQMDLLKEQKEILIAYKYLLDNLNNKIEAINGR